MVPLEESRHVAQEPRPVAELGDLAMRAAGAEAADGARVWVAVIDARDARDPRMGSYLGDQQVAAGSLANLALALTAIDQTRTGELALDGALRARLRAVLADADANAANALLDLICNTAPGPELEGADFTAFDYKRRTVVRHMRRIGLNYLWVVGKQYGDGSAPEGIEAQFLGPATDGARERDNRVTADDTARLLFLLWRAAAVDRGACEEMLAAIRRDGASQTLFSAALPAGVDLYSRDAVSGSIAHDAGIFVGEGDGAVIIVVASAGGGKNLPAAVAKQILAELEFKGRAPVLPLP